MNWLGDFSKITDGRSRSITAENRTGAKGQGGMAMPVEGNMTHTLGRGWKISPCDVLPKGETLTLAQIEGPGQISHIWMTVTGPWRHAILRMYWDGEERPAVEVPLGDFFGQGWGQYASLVSIPVCVNPGSGFNSHWPMPFRQSAKITLENIGFNDIVVFYQIDYEEKEIPEDQGYFHAQFRRSNPVPKGEVHTILDGISGRGSYVGTYLAWGVNNNGWWGEGEVKFYLDGDDEFPTICGTGTEDYICGSYNFENPRTGQYESFTTPHSGLHEIQRPDGLYQSQQRFGMYRWHLTDPIRFQEDIRVTVQALGWRSEGRLLQLQDDLSSTAFWYQLGPTSPYPPLPDRDDLEVI